MNGKFDYNKNSLALSGAKALIFEAATRRVAWVLVLHEVDGWYPIPAMQHYGAQNFFIDSTRGIHISSNAKLVPSHFQMPTIFEEDETVLAAEKH